jgi:hypothetical protein
MFARKLRGHRMRTLFWSGLTLTALFAIFAVGAFAEEPYSTEPAQAHASEYLPKTVLDGLDPQGILLITYSNGIKMPICEIFWAKTVEAQERPAKLRNAPYRNIREGSLVGVIHYLPETAEEYREDFHDQKLKPGYYTMRYEVLPDGDTGDFLVLSPVNLDHDPQVVASHESLFRMGRMASRGDDPAVLSMIPIDPSEEKAASIRTDGAGSCIVQMKLHAQMATGSPANDIKLAIIVVVPPREGAGS